MYLDPSVTFLNHGSFGATPPDACGARRTFGARRRRLSPSSSSIGGCRARWRKPARRSRPSSTRIPLPPPPAEEICAIFAEAITPNTTLAIVDHITSSTAMIMPVDGLVRTCRARGVRIMIDAAHAPGMPPVSVRALLPLLGI